MFATLTAPSFGPVHRGPGKDGQADVCHPRRTGPACFKRHAAGDPRIGQPLDPDTYDYTGHVLWNAHAGNLWRRFTIYLRRHLAASAGLTRKDFDRMVRVSFAKVAEFQARGVVHFHAVIRLDGRSDEGVIPPPAWATVDLLTDAIRTAVKAVRIDAPDLGQPTRHLVWGEQVDVRPIDPGDLHDGPHLSERAVAAYVAKYATKAAETSGTLDRRIKPRDLPTLHEQGVSARHFSTKSRTYSTTLTRLRQARAEFRLRMTFARLPYDPDSTLVVGSWAYAGQGFTPGEAVLAAQITDDPPSPVISTSVPTPAHSTKGVSQ
ncbi:hypothetical protein FLW16_36120 [Microbispora sp. KK1-11]|nr:hypothetical protein FLW16_36120 [Microbispora sp. KK1-11]